MTYDLLPREEPGKPLIQPSPGFTDRLMERIDAYERQQRRRRTSATLLTVICGVGAIFIFGTRPTDDPGKAGIPQKQAGPVTPAVEQAMPVMPAMPHAAPTRSAAKQHAPGARSTAHDHPVASASAVDPPDYIVITLDGKEFRCPPEVLRGSNNSEDQIEQVSNDGKPANHKIAPRGTRRCRAVSPRE